MILPKLSCYLFIIYLFIYISSFYLCFSLFYSLFCSFACFEEISLLASVHFNSSLYIKFLHDLHLFLKILCISICSLEFKIIYKENNASCCLVCKSKWLSIYLKMHVFKCSWYHFGMSFALLFRGLNKMSWLSWHYIFTTFTVKTQNPVLKHILYFNYYIDKLEDFWDVLIKENFL